MSGRTPRRFTPVLAAGLLLLAAWSCTDNPVLPGTNLPPQTALWVRPDSLLGVGVSRQRLHWWGEDPDGTVSGFLFAFSVFPGRVTGPPSPDTLRYSWRSGNDTLMAFPLDTLFRYYTVVVRAVDNSFGRLPDGARVMLHPAPYHDRNGNGVQDAGEESLPLLPGAMDLTPAVETFPVRNTPPRISFSTDPLNPTRLMRQPETTYTAATFSWIAEDDDGNSTLSSYRIALNDTGPGSWLTIPLRDTIVTLVVPRGRSDSAGGGTVDADVYGGSFLGRQFIGRVRGLRLDALNTFYVQAKDVAGEFSPAISLPGPGGVWFVRRPAGRMLILADYITSDSTAALSTYRTELAAVPGGAFATVDVLNIARGVNAAEKRLGVSGVLVPPFVDPALIHTMLLFDYVFWYTDQYPNLGVAQLTLFTYGQNGGRILFSTTFENSVDPRGALRDFAPIDSISSVDLSPTRPPAPPPVAGDTRIPANFIVYADSTGPEAPYPRLAFNAVPGIHSVFMRPVYRRSDARYLYRLQPDSRNRYLGEPTVAVVDGQRRILFVGLPLHLLNNRSAGNPDGLSAFFARALAGEFHPLQRVNRRIF
jgi:hypothetical protein